MSNNIIDNDNEEITSDLEDDINQDNDPPVDSDILEFEQRIISSMYQVEGEDINSKVNPELDSEDEHPILNINDHNKLININDIG